MITKIEPASTTVTIAISRENVLQPLLERGLPLPLTQAQRDRAERGVRAGANHDAAPVPTAHERAHERARAQIEWRLAGRLRVGRLGGRLRLARQHRLVALETVHLEQAQIGGNHIADPQVHDIARNELGHGDLEPDARRDRRTARCLIWECSASTAFSERYSLKKLRPMLIAMIAADDQRLRLVANHRRDDSRDEQQQQQIAPQLADEHRKSADAVREQHVRPVDVQTPPRLQARQTVLRRAQLAQHIGDRQPGSFSEIKPLRLDHLRYQGATAQAKHADTIARGPAAKWAGTRARWPWLPDGSQGHYEPSCIPLG